MLSKLDKKKQNSKCVSCGVRDEPINHIISECRKLAQKEYKTWHAWVGKMQEIEILPYEQVVYAQRRICTGEWDEQSSLEFCYTESPNLDQMTTPSGC